MTRPTPERIEEIRKFAMQAKKQGLPMPALELLAEIDALRADLKEGLILDRMLRNDINGLLKDRDALKAEIETVTQKWMNLFKSIGDVNARALNLEKENVQIKAVNEQIEDENSVLRLRIKDLSQDDKEGGGT